jgi:hypothetical protein
MTTRKIKGDEVRNYFIILRKFINYYKENFEKNINKISKNTKKSKQSKNTKKSKQSKNTKKSKTVKKSKKSKQSKKIKTS